MDLTEHWRTVRVPCEDADGVGGHEDVEKRGKESDGCKLEGWEDGEWNYRVNSNGVSSFFHVFPFYLGLGLGFEVWCPFLSFFVFPITDWFAVWRTMWPDADRLHYLLHTFVVGRHRGPHSLFNTTVFGCGLAFNFDFSSDLPSANRAQAHDDLLQDVHPVSHHFPSRAEI